MSYMVNIEKSVTKVQLNDFLNLIYNNLYSYFVVFDGEIFFNNKPDVKTVDFHWIINSSEYDNSEIMTYSDLSISSNYIEENKLLDWLHFFSIFFESRIYTDVDIDFLDENYYAVWEINGKRRKVSFDDGDGKLNDYIEIQ